MGSKAFSDIITFSRGSLATLTGSNGLVQYAPHNLLTYSEQFDNAAWLKGSATASANTAVAPDGTTTADQITLGVSGANYVFQYSATYTASRTYTASVYIKNIDCSGIRIGFYEEGTNVILATRDVTAEVSASGWTRVSISCTTSAASGTLLRFYVAQNSTGLNTRYLVWGAQLEIGTTATTYNPTTSAAYHGPRLDYDPVTLAAKGILVEEARTNLLPYSQDFSGWGKVSGGSITSTTEIAPDGTATASVFAASVANGELYKFVTLTAGTIFTSSIYLKRKTGTGTVSIRNSANSAWIPVTINSTSWTRVVNDSGASPGNAYCDILLTTAGDSVYVWGGQIEAGAFATSYIPTAGAAVTRSADSATVSGSAFSNWFSGSEGTLYSEAVAYSTAATAKVAVYLGDGTQNNRVFNYFSAVTPASVITTGGVSQASFVFSAPSQESSGGYRNKQAVAYKTNDSAGSANGAAVVTSLSVAVPAMNQAVIGAYATAGAAALNGHIKRIVYYPRRLTDAELQALTA